MASMKETVSFITKMGQGLRVLGRITSLMVLAFQSMQIKSLTLESIRMECCMALEDPNSTMETSTEDTFTKEECKDLDFILTKNLVYGSSPISRQTT